MRTSPDRLSWATTGTSPSAPNLTASSHWVRDTERSYRRLERLSKALVILYLATDRTPLPCPRSLPRDPRLQPLDPVRRRTRHRGLRERRAQSARHRRLLDR